MYRGRRRRLSRWGGISVCVKVGKLGSDFPEAVREPMSLVGMRFSEGSHRGAVMEDNGRLDC